MPTIKQIEKMKHGPMAVLPIQMEAAPVRRPVPIVTALQALPSSMKTVDVYVKSSAMTSIARGSSAQTDSNCTNLRANAVLCALMNVTAMQTAQTVKCVVKMVYAPQTVSNVALVRMD